ncbi:hypothetical protein LSH36_1709g00000 [Paralvinella palmiformis]|uniref:G-protein coupled receptors family 1 profile domain-containing protein n=1 Tax=Paralvinella palmiformis TaxID=53620 RepID=A0AAD9MQU2_9ANNE|nr:hypothetical protein LSH36_1709g00000 [Paralvinella palmiformis]
MIRRRQRWPTFCFYLQSLFDVMHDSELWHLPICQSHLESIRWPLSGPFNDTERGGNNATALPPLDPANSLSQVAPASRRGIQWIQILLPVICSVGISGNVLNLIVLTRKRFCAPMGKLERSANLGLTALALSDMMFCVAVLPNVFLTEENREVAAAPPRGRHLLMLYYRIYGISCINLFLMTSTWLIVALAIERYIVLYYPLKAKWLLSLKRTKVILVLIHVISALLTLPYFLHLRVTRCVGLDGLARHEILPRWRAPHSLGGLASNIYILHIWPVVAVFLPLLVLFICNIRLVQGLRNVPTTRRLKCPGQKIRDVNTRITLTLIIIVATALILVTPSEILKVINPYKRWGSWGAVVASIANLLQSVNFAFNFVLYCAIDRNFRQICRNVVLGYCRPRSAIPGETEVIFFYRPKTGSFSMRGAKHSDTTSSRSERLFL